MLVVLGFLLVCAASVPLGLWRYDHLGSEGLLYALGLFAAGMGCFFALRLQGDDD